jgi:hypothetical protein
MDFKSWLVFNDEICDGFGRSENIIDELAPENRYSR